MILAGDEGDFVHCGSGSDALHGGEGDDIIHGHSLDQAEIDAILLANSNVVWNAQTNSFYELVSSAVTWDVAKAAAEASLISGTAGHLAVVTSQTESDYLLNDLIPGQAWLGGANLLINNDWLWYGGPENGLQFWQGTSGGSSINNFYQNFKSGQPNNAGGNQYYLRKESSSGEWLDDAETTRNYIIEWDAGLISDDNAADSISGGVGNDTLYGYGGDDVLIGDASNVYYEESLKYFYKLDENEGTGADEILGSGLDITLGAGNSWVSSGGADGGAYLDFDGVGATASFGSLTVGGALTFSLWGRFDTIQSSWRRLFQLSNGSSTDQIHLSNVNGTDAIGFYIDKANTEMSVKRSAAGVIVAGEWAYWTATVDSLGIWPFIKMVLWLRLVQDIHHHQLHVHKIILDHLLVAVYHLMVLLQILRFMSVASAQMMLLVFMRVRSVILKSFPVM